MLASFEVNQFSPCKRRFYKSALVQEKTPHFKTPKQRCPPERLIATLKGFPTCLLTCTCTGTSWTWTENWVNIQSHKNLWKDVTALTKMHVFLIWAPNCSSSGVTLKRRKKPRNLTKWNWQSVKIVRNELDRFTRKGNQHRQIHSSVIKRGSCSLSILELPKIEDFQLIVPNSVDYDQCSL